MEPKICNLYKLNLWLINFDFRILLTIFDEFLATFDNTLAFSLIAYTVKGSVWSNWIRLYLYMISLLRCKRRIYGVTGTGLQEGWFRPVGVCEWRIPRREEAFAEEHKKEGKVQQTASRSFQFDEARRGGWSGETEEGPEHFEGGDSETETAAGEFACSAH